MIRRDLQAVGTAHFHERLVTRLSVERMCKLISEFLRIADRVEVGVQIVLASRGA